MVFCTDIITNTAEKIFAWGTSNPRYANRYLESKIKEIHFSNGLVFEFNHSSCLSAELSWFLIRNNFKPFGSKFENTAITELRSFPCNGYKLLNYLDYIGIESFNGAISPDAFYPAIKKTDKNYGVVPDSLTYLSQMNSICDIILLGELSPQDLSYLYNRQDDIISIIYTGFGKKGKYYKYKYKVLDPKKFQTLLTKIHIQYYQFFQ